MRPGIRDGAAMYRGEENERRRVGKGMVKMKEVGKVGTIRCTEIDGDRGAAEVALFWNLAPKLAVP